MNCSEGQPLAVEYHVLVKCNGVHYLAEAIGDISVSPMASSFYKFAQLNSFPPSSALFPSYPPPFLSPAALGLAHRRSCIATVVSAVVARGLVGWAATSGKAFEAESR